MTQQVLNVAVHLPQFLQLLLEKASRMVGHHFRYDRRWLMGIADPQGSYLEREDFILLESLHIYRISKFWRF